MFHVKQNVIEMLTPPFQRTFPLPILIDSAEALSTKTNSLKSNLVDIYNSTGPSRTSALGDCQAGGAGRA